MGKRKRPKPSELAKPASTPQPPHETQRKNNAGPEKRTRRHGPKPVKRLNEAKAEATKAERLEPSAGQSPWKPNARDLELYGIYCEGDKSQRELAAQYKLGASTVHEIIRKVEAYFAAESVMQIRELRARATQRLESIFAKAIQSYKRSLEDEVTITTKDGGDKIETTEQRRGQAGSAAFLAQAREAVSDLMDVWGAKAPKSLAIEVTKPLRVGGRTPEEALKIRIAHLQTLAETIHRDPAMKSPNDD